MSFSVKWAIISREIISFFSSTFFLLFLNVLFQGRLLLREMDTHAGKATAFASILHILPKRLMVWGKKFALQEQILFFKTRPLSGRLCAKQEEQQVTKFVSPMKFSMQMQRPKERTEWIWHSMFYKFCSRFSCRNWRTSVLSERLGRSWKSNIFLPV